MATEKPGGLQLVSPAYQYREKLGLLLYYMIIMRPVLSRCNSRPTVRAAASLSRALNYAYNTRHLTLAQILQLLDNHIQYSNVKNF